MSDNMICVAEPDQIDWIIANDPSATFFYRASSGSLITFYSDMQNRDKLRDCIEGLLCVGFSAPRLAERFRRFTEAPSVLG